MKRDGPRRICPAILEFMTFLRLQFFGKFSGTGGACLPIEYYLASYDVQVSSAGKIKVI